MSGGYTNKTKIGNWSEEQEQENARLKEYLKKKEKGLLTTQQLASYTEKIHLAKSSDGNVRDGDFIMLCSLHNKGVLSLDLGTELPGSPIRYATSSSFTALPCARNVFRISKAPGEQQGSLVILYGEKIVLTTTEHLKSAAKTKYDRLCLSTQLVTSSVFAKYTHYQEVAFTTEPPSTFGNHWQILYHDPKLRMEMEGSPVQAGKPIIINHCKTNAHLGSGATTWMNDFGTENEVFARTMLDQFKVEQTENVWTIEDRSLQDVV
eukprot:Phypoly_transcript_16532.p1 GENE.Phypoly_transcript_16532~~Phypoly_transcript_16532.p1  ORF type:complete len:264 (+),score=35.25 Phypoly_transcript_16532:34-825(+)